MNAFNNYRIMENQSFDFDSIDEVCFIDDDASYLFLNTVIFRFTYPRFKPVTFQEPEEAFQYLKNNPDTARLVFLDLHMHRWTGFELLEKLEPLHLSNTQVIMHTTCEDEKNIRTAFSYPLVKAYTTKPLSIEMMERLSGENLDNTLPLGQLGIVQFKTYL
jgi:response regulator of citrate/malate metabolism